MTQTTKQPSKAKTGDSSRSSNCSSVTRVKHKARGVDRRIVELADQIGLPLFRRDKELWLNGDLQLTYRKRTVNGETRDCTDEDRVEIAVGILKSVIAAREEWGTVKQRWNRILAGLREAVPRYMPRTYTYHREPSLDCGWMIKMPYSPKWEMAIELIGKKPVRVSDGTAEGCLERLADCCVDD